MKRKSIYKYAAEAGLPVGLYLSLMSACFLMSLRIDFLPMLIFPLSLVFPFFLGIMMKRIGQSEPSYMKISSLWLGGIYTVIFGTLISMLLSSLYVVFVEPGFVASYVSNAIAAAENSPMATEYAGTITLMKEALKAHILPTGMQFVATMAWFTCFVGSVLSLFIAVILTKTVKKPSRYVGQQNQ